MLPGTSGCLRQVPAYYLCVPASNKHPRTGARMRRWLACWLLVPGIRELVQSCMTGTSCPADNKIRLSNKNYMNVCENTCARFLIIIYMCHIKFCHTYFLISATVLGFNPGLTENENFFLPVLSKQNTSPDEI